MLKHFVFALEQFFYKGLITPLIALRLQNSSGRDTLIRITLEQGGGEGVLHTVDSRSVQLSKNPTIITNINGYILR